jgi:hypothetical protein
VLLSKERRKWLLRDDGYRLAMEYKDEKERLVYLPGDNKHPEKKNRLKLVDKDGSLKEYFITSARVTTIGREMRGGSMGDRFGVVCAVDTRRLAKSEQQIMVGNDDYLPRTLGGGKVQPDYDGTSNTRLWPGEDCELVRGAAVSENYEELEVPFLEKESWIHANGRDHELWGNRYFLYGIRLITETIKSPDPNDPAQEIETTRVKTEGGLECADAMFIAITNIRLGNFEGQRGETGQRTVKPASELLRRLPHEVEKKTGKILPVAQAFALAMAIKCSKEIFGASTPDSLKEVIAEGEAAAERMSTNRHYSPYFIKCIQESNEWVV